MQACRHGSCRGLRHAGFSTQSPRPAASGGHAGRRLAGAASRRLQLRVQLLRGAPTFFSFIILACWPATQEAMQAVCLDASRSAQVTCGGRDTRASGSGSGDAAGGRQPAAGRRERCVTLGATAIALAGAAASSGQHHPTPGRATQHASLHQGVWEFGGEGPHLPLPSCQMPSASRWRPCSGMPGGRQGPRRRTLA